MQDFDNMPMRESMRDSHKEEKIDFKEYYGEVKSSAEKELIKNYRIIDRKLKRSINQNYDNIYSWLCNKYKTNPNFGYLKSYFLDQFEETAATINKGERALYKLDEDKKIIKAE